MRKFYWFLMFFALFVSCEPRKNKPVDKKITVRESVFVVYKVEPDDDNPGFALYSVKMSDYRLRDIDFRFRDRENLYLVGTPLHLESILSTVPTETVPTAEPVIDTVPVPVKAVGLGPIHGSGINETPVKTTNISNK